MDEKNALFRNKGNTAIEEATEDTIVEDKTNELLCSQEDPVEGGKGFIFLCNSMTKQDCLRYKLLGLPANKREIVERVYKGMRLFMFDVDSREMYGIYEAAEPGGYNVVPKAFNSRFPSQVRFTILEDCLPLRELVFREAIKDNYYTKWEFHSQLTSDQVKDLCKLFSTATKDGDGDQGDSCIPVVPMASSWQLRNRDAEITVVRSREKEEEKKREEEEEEEKERKKKLLKDSEMNRYIEDECRTLEMLIQSTAAKGEAMHLAVEKVEEDIKLLEDLEMQRYEESMRLGMLIQSTAEEYKAIKHALGDVDPVYCRRI